MCCLHKCDVIRDKGKRSTFIEFLKICMPEFYSDLFRRSFDIPNKCSGCHIIIAQNPLFSTSLFVQCNLFGGIEYLRALIMHSAIGVLLKYYTAFSIVPCI